MKNKKTISIIVGLVIAAIIGCTALLPKKPNHELWRQDNLWCWHKHQDGKWRVIGNKERCPSNTQFNATPPSN